MSPANALGHVAGELAVVPYGMLNNLTPYDQAKHRQELGLAQPDHASAPATVDVSSELIDTIDGASELVMTDSDTTEDYKLAP